MMQGETTQKGFIESIFSPHHAYQTIVLYGMASNKQQRSTSIVPFLQELEESRKSYMTAPADIQYLSDENEQE
jgi:hypothetical protein